MAEFALGDEDWSLVLDEFRQLVISAGFAAWDQSMLAALHEEEEGSTGGRATLLRYGWEFVRFLKVRSADNLLMMRDRMADLIRTPEGQKLEEAVVMAPNGRELPLLSGEPSDEIVRELTSFLLDISGEHGGYFDGENAE